MLVLQRQKDEQSPAKNKEDGLGQKDAKKAQPSARIKELRKELVATLQSELTTLDGRVRAGQALPDEIAQTSNHLMEAQLELSTDKKERLQAIEANYKRLQECESMAKARHEAGRGTSLEFTRAKASRLEIEILLAKEKGE